MTPDPRLSAFIRGLSLAPRLAVRPATRSRRAMLPPLFWLALVWASGCRSAETRLEIVSLKNPAAQERLSEHFDRVSFAVNAQNNWDIVLEIPPTSLRVQPAGPTAATAPADPAASPSPALDMRLRASPASPGLGREASVACQGPAPAEPDEVLMSQFICINVFWRPIPGRSFVESTQTNATIVYCLVTDRDVIAYQGAGFVSFTPSRDGQTIQGEIESSDLAPGHYVNRPVDVFGPCRIQGTFTAKLDRRHVVAVRQRLRKLIGPPTAPLPPPNPLTSVASEPGG